MKKSNIYNGTAIKKNSHFTKSMQTALLFSFISLFSSCQNKYELSTNQSIDRNLTSQKIEIPQDNFDQPPAEVITQPAPVQPAPIVVQPPADVITQPAPVQPAPIVVQPPADVITQPAPVQPAPIVVQPPADVITQPAPVQPAPIVVQPPADVITQPAPVSSDNETKTSGPLDYLAGNQIIIRFYIKYNYTPRLFLKVENGQIRLDQMINTLPESYSTCYLKNPGDVCHSKIVGNTTLKTAQEWVEEKLLKGLSGEPVNQLSTSRAGFAMTSVLNSDYSITFYYYQSGSSFCWRQSNFEAYSAYSKGSLDMKNKNQLNQGIYFDVPDYIIE